MFERRKKRAIGWSAGAIAALALAGSVFAQSAPETPPGPVAPAVGSPQAVSPTPAPQPAGGYGPELAARLDAEAGRTAYNSLYVEFGGAGLAYTINYDRMLGEHASARVGIMYLAAGAGSQGARVAILPVVANLLLGHGNHKFELGAGVDVFLASSHGIGGSFAAGGVIGTGVIGYRYSPRHGGFNFRVGLTPLFDANNFLPMGGISFGYGF